MHLDIHETTREEHPTLEALLQLYAYDFSDALTLDVSEQGRYLVPSLAPYGADPGAHAFLVRADGAYAGFALLQARSYLTGASGVHDMAEFFVLRRFRRHGIGAGVATRLFDRFPGPWEIRQRRENTMATAFWRRVLDHYTGGAFAEELLDDARWRGPVQRFDSRARAGSVGATD
jgi:predicted acetyltransferase